MVTAGITVTNVMAGIQYSRITTILNRINKTKTEKMVKQSYNRIIQPIEITLQQKRQITQ